ncbi:MAG: hypothetical protein LBC08_01855, partial [Campylobacteraceae bacterium]|nr:hypothetical protein [Campylobacteraceae bacterium]
FKQVLTLYPRKIKNTSATQMRGFKDYYFISLLRRFATRNDEREINMDSRLRGNDGREGGFTHSLTICVFFGSFRSVAGIRNI